MKIHFAKDGASDPKIDGKSDDDAGERIGNLVVAAAEGVVRGERIGEPALNEREEDGAESDAPSGQSRKAEEVEESILGGAGAFVGGNLDAGAIFEMVGEESVDVFLGPLAAAEKGQESFVGGALAAGGVEELFQVAGGVHLAGIIAQLWRGVARLRRFRSSVISDQSSVWIENDARRVTSFAFLQSVAADSNLRRLERELKRDYA